MRMKKTTAAILVTAMAMGMTVFPGCSKSDSSKVSSDDQWFNITKSSAQEYYDNIDFVYDDMWSNCIGSDAEKIYVLTNLYKNMNSEEIDDDKNSQDFEKTFIDIYSIENGYERSVSIDDSLTGIDGSYYVQEGKLKDNAITLDVYAYHPTSGGMYEDTMYQVTFDIDTEEFSEPVEVGYQDESSDWEEMSRKVPDGSYEGSWEIGDYTIARFYIWSENSDKTSYVLLITDKDGNETTLDLRTLMPDYSVWDISTYLDIDEDSILIIPSCDSEEQVYFKLTLSSKALEDVSQEYAWFECDPWGLQTIEGQGMYFLDNSDYYHPILKKVDMEEQKIEDVIDFRNSNINPMDMWNLNLITVTDNSVVMAGQTNMTANSQGTFNVITLTEAEENPNAGKAILKAASLSGYNYAIFESICEFNEANDEYFIQIDDRYNIETNMDWENVPDNTDWTSNYLNQAASLGDQLTVDLMAGDGPDILFNAYSLPQLNNSDYLVDLSGRITDPDNYFSNIFDAVSVNGALYQVPMIFTPEGISTYSEFTEDDQIGFTFDDYRRFVDQVCNGTDPLLSNYTTQLDYFMVCYASVSDMFVSGNGVNYNNDAFRDLAQYVKDYVTDVPEDDPEIYGDYAVYEPYMTDDVEKPNATAGSIGSIYDFFYNYGDRVNDVRFLGYPSSDARGPMFNIQLSVAVSASSSNLDGCYQFVDLFLARDMQMTAAREMWGLPVNISVFDEIAQTALDDHNKNAEYYLEYFTTAEIREYGLDTSIYDESVIDYFKSVINNCKVAQITDAYVAIIIREEMQAYFSGQKTLDAVIDTMTNRVTTYLTERG